jgi:hypothetical protein
LLRRDSHDPRTLEEVRRILVCDNVDFLFIDGDHTYEEVEREGLLLFMILFPESNNPENVGGVPDFWNEIEHGFSYVELVKGGRQSGYGIGALHV